MNLYLKWLSCVLMFSNDDWLTTSDKRLIPDHVMLPTMTKVISTLFYPGVGERERYTTQYYECRFWPSIIKC